MSDGKIRVLILSLCIGGSVLAGISSREAPSLPLPRVIGHSVPFLKALAAKAFLTLQQSRRAAGLKVTGGSATTGEEPTVSGSPGLAGRWLNDFDKALPPVAARSRYRNKTLEELGIEKLIKTAFQKHFRDYRIAGKSLTLRMPFGLNYEREGTPGYSQVFYLGGKGTPEQLWPHIDSVLASQAFGKYVNTVTSPGEKVIIFELERRSYSVSRDEVLIGSLKEGSYPGTPTRIFVQRSTTELTEADVYNYLYAVASVGMDCSGFTYYVHECIAQAYGMDLNQMLSERWRMSPNQVRKRVGLWFYDPANGYTETIGDRIEDLRPADIILFRGSDGKLKHSAVIQSIDFKHGLLRYVQSTDWAIEPERGVHKSVIRFDPFRPQVNLSHYSVMWMQKVRPPFDGELEPRDWRTDGDRYMWYPAAGGSLVVRLQYLADMFLKRDPLFYSNAYGEQNSAQ